MIEPGPLEWLLDLLADAGTIQIEFTVRGVVFLPLSWVEITAWVEGAQQHHVAPYWRRLIIGLSEAYAQQAQAAIAFECQAPFDPAEMSLNDLLKDNSARRV